MSWSSMQARVSGLLHPAGRISPELKTAFDRQLLRAFGPLTFCLAGVFASLSVLHFLDPISHAAVVPIVATDVVSAGFFLLLRVALSRGRIATRWANGWGLSIVSVILVNVLVAFAATGESFFLSYLLILIVGCSALMLSLPWLLASIGLSLVTSASVAWTVVSPGAFYHYGLPVFAASALAVAISIARIRAAVRTQVALNAALEEADGRQTAEDALRGSEERLELAIAGSEGGWWDIKMDPNRPDELPDAIGLDPSIKGFIGFQDDEFPSSIQKWRERILPEDREAHAIAVADHLAGRSLLLDIEYRIRHKDGGVRWIYSRGRIHRDADGRPLRWSGIDWDITDSKQTQDRLHLLTRAVEQSPSLVIITDTEGVIEYVNPKFTRATGYSAEEVIGKNPSLLKSEQTAGKTHRELWQTITAGREWHGEFNNAKKDGTSYWVISSVSPIKDAGGVTRHYLAVQEDVTERKKVEARLVQAQKMETVGQLVSGVAHDFNNLLTSVIGFAELAVDQVNEDDPVLQDLLEIQQAAESAGELTGQLLAFSRQQVLRPRVVSLNAVLTGIEELLRRSISEHIELEMHLDPNVGRVKVDPTQMEQILINLAINGRDAMPGGGKLTIETSNRELGPDDVGGNVNGFAGSFVQLAVSDEGSGMDAATRERIFEPFFTTKEPGSGTGLGLATVYGTVKQSGGFIWVYSEPGRGSTFKIYLPRMEKTGASIPPEAVAASELRGTETILLVEDHDAVRRASASILERNGYRVIALKDPLQALETSKDMKVDLLLSDIVMPGLNGVSLAEQIQEQHPKAKLVLMSGYSEAAARKSLAMDSGIEYLSKPFRLGELLCTVRKSLESGT